MFKIIILSQIGADRYQKLIFEILLLSPPWRTVQWSNACFLFCMQTVLTKAHSYIYSMTARSELTVNTTKKSRSISKKKSTYRYNVPGF